MNDNNIGAIIRKRRKELHISQEELARRTGYSGRSAINKIELSVNGLKQPKVKVFADALQTTEAYLIGMVDDPNWKPETQDYAAKFNDDDYILIEQYHKADSEKQRLVAYLLGLDKK